MDHVSPLIVYVTSHGFGHLNRTVAVLNQVPPQVPITIKCDPSLFDHWGERLHRHASFKAYVSDAGALNPPGDSSKTDGPGSIARAMAIHEDAMLLIDEEVAFLKGAGAVLVDAPPLPLLAAKRAGVPGFLLGNFTWAEIYAPHAKKLGEDEIAFVHSLNDCYSQATAVFRTEPALAMTHIGPIENVGMVVTPGRDRRAELRALFQISKNDKIVYFYIGRYGQANLPWKRLGKFAGVHFVGFHPPAGGPLANFHVVPPQEWTGADLAASADVMVAKAGYGTACEAMVSGTPFVYPPRTGFAEHRALDRALRAWGGGVPATAREFAELQLETLLDRAFRLKPGPPPFDSHGAKIVAERLTVICNNNSSVHN